MFPASRVGDEQQDARREDEGRDAHEDGVVVHAGIDERLAVLVAGRDGVESDGSGGETCEAGDEEQDAQLFGARSASATAS